MNKKEEYFASTQVVTEVEGVPIVTDEALDRADPFETEPFSAEEERILRMRYGANLAPGAALGSKLEGLSSEALKEVEARLILIEANVRAYVAETQDARKRHIIDALRSKN